MDSTALLVSLQNSAQKAPSTTEPLSAELLQYRLARTPTLRRFNRNRNVITPQTPKKPVSHDQNTPSFPRADFRPASELVNHAATVEAPHSSSIRIARRRPAPKLYSTLLQSTPNSTLEQPYAFVSRTNGLADGLSRTTVSELQEKASDMSSNFSGETDDLTLNEAIRAAAILSHVKHINKVPENTQSPIVEKGQIAPTRSHVSKTQLSLNGAEKKRLKRPTKCTPLPPATPSIQKQTVFEEAPNSRQFSIPDEDRPTTTKKRSRARRLPVDELELTEERLPAYDASTILDSDDESDLVEEPTGRTLRSKRRAKQSTTVGKATESRKKPLPVRTKAQSRRWELLTGFKVIKRPVTASTSQKNSFEQLIIGDGFEGLERIPTGRTVRSANKRRQTRPRIALPTEYFKALELVESKPFEKEAEHGHGFQGIKVDHNASDLAEQLHHSEQLSDHESHDRDIEQGVGFSMAAGERHVAAIPHVCLTTVTNENGDETLQARSLKLLREQSTLADAHIHDKARPLSHCELMEKSISVLADAETSGDCPKSVTVSSQELQKSAAMESQLVFQTDDHQLLHPDTVHSQSDVTCVEPSIDVNEGLPRPKRLNRSVTFSDEARVFTDVESENATEEKTASEAQSSVESDSEPGNESDQSHKSDTEESSSEDDVADGSDGDTEDNEDDYDDDYPMGNLACRCGSPELVSSGYYDATGNSTQPYFSFNENEKVCISSDEECSTPLGEECMMFDGEEEMEDLQELPQHEEHKTRGLENFIDSDEEMLIATSREASSGRQSPSGDHYMAIDEIAPYPGRGRRSRRQCDQRAYSEPERLHDEGDSTSFTGMYDIRDEELPSTRDENIEEPSHVTNSKNPRNRRDMLSFGEVQSGYPLGCTTFTPYSNTNPSGPHHQARRQDRVSKVNDNNRTAAAAFVTPPTRSFAIREHYDIPHPSGQQRRQHGARNVGRAKVELVGIGARLSTPVRNTVVTDVPSYFTRASQALSSPPRDAVTMMRRAMTLPSTQYVSESGDENGFIVMPDESFRERLSGRKRHLSVSDSVVEDKENIDVKELVKKSNMEAGRSTGMKRKKSLPFKPPFKESS